LKLLVDLRARLLELGLVAGADFLKPLAHDSAELLLFVPQTIRKSVDPTPDALRQFTEVLAETVSNARLAFEENRP